MLGNLSSKEIYNISRGDIDLSGESKGNLDFLYRILHEEQSLRDSARVIKWEQESRLPRREFETERLNSGTRWQIEPAACRNGNTT